MSEDILPGVPMHVVDDLVERALAEDLGAAGDVTTAATVAATVLAAADLVPRADGVVAGLPVAAYVFDTVSQGRVRVEYGDRRRRAGVRRRGAGHRPRPVRDLLTAERTALNLLGHLSGIATLTRAWVDAVAGTGARIRDTRKTTPGLRALEKYAVRCGGGVNHRMSLSDAALVKDNHVVAAGGVVAAFERVRAAYPDLPIEVEVDTVEQAREVIDAGADLVLLDNMGLGGACAPSSGSRPAGAKLEASGGLRARQRPGGRRDRRRLPRGRRADPLGAGPRHRLGYRTESTTRNRIGHAARDRHRQHQHRPRRLRRRRSSSSRGGSRPTPAAPPTSWR